jgi:hypothetical protein
MLAVLDRPMISDSPGRFFDILSQRADIMGHFLFGLFFSFPFLLKVHLRVTYTMDWISCQSSMPAIQSVVGNRR